MRLESFVLLLELSKTKLVEFGRLYKEETSIGGRQPERLLFLA